MASLSDLQSIIETLDCYPSVLRGEVSDKCSQFSRELRRALKDAAIPAIMVGGDARSGKIMHNYVYCKLEEGIQLVDLTAGQFVPELKGKVFIGNREALLRMAQSSNPNRDWSVVWALEPMVWLSHDDRLGMNQQAAEDFQREWAETGAVMPSSTRHRQR